MILSSEAEMKLFKDFKGLYVYVQHGAKGVCYILNLLRSTFLWIRSLIFIHLFKFHSSVLSQNIFQILSMSFKYVYLKEPTSNRLCSNYVCDIYVYWRQNKIESNNKKIERYTCFVADSKNRLAFFDVFWP